MFNILKALLRNRVNKRNINSFLVSTFKGITCPILEYANTIGALSYQYQHQETVNCSDTGLQIAIGCTQDTNTQHLHDETKVLPMDTHLKLHATQLKQLTQTQTHPLHDLNAYSDPPRNMKATIFHNKSSSQVQTYT